MFPQPDDNSVLLVSIGRQNSLKTMPVLRAKTCPFGLGSGGGGQYFAIKYQINLLSYLAEF